MIELTSSVVSPQGTRQFLSVGMLDENPKTAEISDELESFLYLLLYFAVRYLRSSCDYPEDFIEGYFNAYTVQHGFIKCGRHKRLVVTELGRLEDYCGSRLTFRSPMDYIFKELLPLFKAHYKVQAHRKKKSAPPTSPTSSAHYETSSIHHPQMSREGGRDTSKYRDLEEPVLTRKRFQVTRKDDSIPTAEDEQDAALLADHDFVLGALAQAYVSKGWGWDKVGDRVLDPCASQPIVEPMSAPNARPLKRRRSAGSVDVRVGVQPDTVRFRKLPRLTQSFTSKAG